MTSRHDKAQATSKARLLSRRDFLDLCAVFLDAAGKGVEIGLVRHLEPRIVHPRHIPLPQNDTVSVELIPGSQIDPAICFAADLVKPDAIHIML